MQRFVRSGQPRCFVTVIMLCYIWLYISKRTLPEKAMSQQLNIDAMTIEKLWYLHAKISRVLSDRLTSRKLELENLLARLSAATNVELSDQPEALSSKGPA